ncbi:dihydrofolate reductase family protein [Nocardioides zeae]|uniref:Dihydrofolate reductase family protein n=1 Tax=Nocardioides imazamoxiresistens TaxID=3231893 RepID=A0ABU3PWQ7_9ACTN|nr:dihydrofolate reductase family protein [Nocardioides zeae]MDT9593664.1 dihydrofolate reductase family protein [Nocardioides zeae]
MSTVYCTATSLDGFIATDDHSLDWLLSRRIDEDGPENMGEFLPAIGAQLMGASTYEWVARHAGGSPWEYAAPTWVLTHRGEELAAGRPSAWAGADLRFAAADGDDALRALHAEAAAAAGGRDVWVVGGGELVGRLADLDLLDEVVLSYAPCVLGSGAPLLPRRVELELRATARNADFVTARYAVVR